MINHDNKIVFTAHTNALEPMVEMLTRYTETGRGPHRDIRISVETVEVRRNNTEETHIDIYLIPTVVFV
jgi:hypothetical protein